MTTPEELRSARLAAKKSQAKAAELMGYSLGAWRKWEAGTRPIPAKLLHFFKMELDKS